MKTINSEKAEMGGGEKFYLLQRTVPMHSVVQKIIQGMGNMSADKKLQNWATQFMSYMWVW